MSAEFYIRFGSVKWYQINHQMIIDNLCSLSCFVKENTNKEFWLLGLEDRNNAERWEFDMHLFLKKHIYIEREILVIQKQFSKICLSYLNG